jgi:4-amino-4-deoxy-L-arabinose transferase-like glycosyltransferase
LILAQSLKNTLNFQKYPLDIVFLIPLTLAALLLYTHNVGNLPLRDWDEGTIAQVAREISTPTNSWSWLFPTLLHEPYFNKPPFLHGLIALAYGVFGVNEFSARLPGALLSAAAIPLIYWLGVELFANRLGALFSALVYLTLFPLVRHGRLAMLDGAAISFFLGMLICLLRSRRDSRWGLGVGLGFSLICLTKATLGLLLGGIAFLFLAWDTPRLLRSGRFWLGCALGAVPCFTWFALQVWHYRQDYITTIQREYLTRVVESIHKDKYSFIIYFRSLLQNAFPWLIFWLSGLFLAFKQIQSSWAKLVLVWVSFYLLAICLMQTKLNWYILPIYPALALSAGMYLATAWQRGRFYLGNGRLWLTVVSVILLGVILYIWIDKPVTLVPSWLPWDRVKLVLVLSAGLCGLAWYSRECIILLILGMYGCLLLLFHTSFWVWELDEAFLVKPVAEMVQRTNIDPKAPIFMTFDFERPSLNFYSDRRIQPRKPEDIQKYWQSGSGFYVLTDPATLKSMNLTGVEILGKAAPDWILLTKKVSS